MTPRACATRWSLARASPLAVAGPLCLAAILLAGPFVDAWVGPGYEDARLVVVYLVSSLLLATVSRTGLLMLQGSGRIRAPAAIVWAEAVLNFGLSIALGLLLGLTGVALATLIATAAVSTSIGIPYICRTFGVPTSTFVLTVARAHVPAVCVALLTGWLVSPDEGSGLVAVLAAGSPSRRRTCSRSRSRGSRGKSAGGFGRSSAGSTRTQSASAAREQACADHRRWGPDRGHSAARACGRLRTQRAGRRAGVGAFGAGGQDMTKLGSVLEAFARQDVVVDLAADPA